MCFGPIKNRLRSDELVDRETTARLSESAFQTCLVNWARKHGWLVHHARTARESSGRYATPIQGDKGFPDLVLVKEGRVVFAELKSERGRIKPDQVRWRDAITKGAVEYYLWRPSDWERILEVLGLDPIPLWRCGGSKPKKPKRKEVKR